MRWLPIFLSVVLSSTLFSTEAHSKPNLTVAEALRAIGRDKLPSILVAPDDGWRDDYDDRKRQERIAKIAARFEYAYPLDMSKKSLKQYADADLSPRRRDYCFLSAYKTSAFDGPNKAYGALCEEQKKEEWAAVYYATKIASRDPHPYGQSASDIATAKFERALAKYRSDLIDAGCLPSSCIAYPDVDY